MPPTSSLGAGPPKHRTINVEVNLLAEWLERRNRHREERLRWTGLLTSFALIGIVSATFLSDYAAEAEGRARKAEKIALAKDALLGSLQQQQSLVQPKIDGEATLELSRKRSRQFLQELVDVLNATSPKMAVEMVEGSILGGEMTVKAKAQSESYEAAQEYVSQAERGPRVRSAILTTARPNRSLATEGVTFEFAKKVEVSQ